MSGSGLLDAELLALAVGFGGQALFSARMLVQWIASERAQRSVVPEAFWQLSLAGGVTLMAYAAWRRDPVFLLGQASGLVVYARNLWLIRQNKAQESAAAADAAAAALPVPLPPQGQRSA